MMTHEVTRGVAPGVAPRGDSLGGLPWEPSHKRVFFVQPPKLSDWASLLQISREFKAKIEGK